ncbi:MAG TPA: hypothetical protein VGR57_18080 [Ktedonobacterales bacterium]|nr:hypothetical protein [Ktedonobacterales bacterium]
MPTNVEDVLSAAHALPRDQQIELLRRLLDSLTSGPDGLDAASLRFWAPRSLEELATERDTPIVADIRTLALLNWPADESADDVIAYLRDQRHADRGA